ncbi:MAG TPA: PSD1 and planctomycete cytochrome C domain-containing protein [Bryobacteraceae bacterium]|nr:PSD1 and planctomycete cytochrome C domain-containing protein [Bryobacteraceae bacterium]
MKCHSGDGAQGGLDVRTPAGLVRGGAKGAAIIAGNGAQSLLYQRVASGQMPLAAKPLTSSESDLIKQWIDQGAKAENPQATTDAIGTSTRDRSHWAFQAPRRPTAPLVRERARVRNPVDAFLLVELEKRGLSFSTDADRIKLIRRATFDLTGLPPTPVEVADFLNDASAQAYEKVIDRLLNSPRYGERWGRHWLDLAGYADSEGVLGADVLRPNAWRYRDYVIRAFNHDKPYDQFVKEQLAGDELSRYRRYDKLPAGVVDMLEATGFLRTAVDATREDFLPADFAEYQWRTLFDTQQIVASSLMGLTLQCARCHDHKYEPVSQKDYYRLMAILQGAIRPNGPVLPSDKRAIVEATREQKAAAGEVNGPLDMIIKALGDLKAGRTQEYRSKHPDGEEVTDEELRKTFPEYAKISDDLAAQIKAEDAKRTKFSTIRAIYDVDGSPPPTTVLAKGDPLSPAETVQPGVPAVLDDPAQPFRIDPKLADPFTTGRRQAFAEWLTRPGHPLTARVLVNHLWAHHFGAGIVPTPDNFGRSGAAPTNQSLLDWLATEFVAQGWKIKSLHRLIMTSTAYRQDSAVRGTALKADADNILLWRFPPRRLEGEAIRDAVLAASGALDLKMFGRPVPAKTKPTGEVVPVEEAQSGRRSVYQVVRRSAPQSFLQFFDAPVMETNCIRRVNSTSALQSLAFMNSDFATAQAGRFAMRIMKEAPPASNADAGTVKRAIELAFSRPPREGELESMLAFLRKQATRYPALGPEALTKQIYADLCQVLLSANEFVYVD